MEKKQRLLSTFGTICFLTGALLVLAVIVIWQVAPIFTPPDYGRLSTGSLSDNDLAALAKGPALSPFTPPIPAAENGQTLLPSSILPESDMHSLSAATYLLPDAGDMGRPALSHSNGVSAKSDQMRVAIPALGLDAPVLPVGLESKPGGGQRSHKQWTVPDEYAAGWHAGSASPGQPGNIVLNGHNNIHGAIFHDLVDLPLGAEIILYDAGQPFVYEVTGREFLQEQGQPLRNRLRNARWIMPTDDERITIVTCWPNTSNSHRLVVVAQPVEKT